MEQSGCSRCEERKKQAAGDLSGCPELFSRQISYALRGAAILMVMASHYGEWYAASIGMPALSQFLMGLGRYGVDIFFLMSGYAMAKNATEKKPGRAFWAKRLRGTYVPYLILAGIIEICAGGVYSAGRIVNYLLAQEYWFIFNIMVFYLAFFLCFQAKRFRIAALSFMTAAFSAWLSGMGRQDFWYVSNLAFPLGAAFGLYEKRLLVWMEGKRFRAVLPATLLCILLVPAAMRERALLLQTGGRGKLQLAANTLFSLWIALFPWPVKRVRPVGCMAGGVLRFFGKNSLYLYLLHPFLYYQTAGRWNLGAAGSFVVAFGSAILGAWLFSLLWKAASAKMSVAGKRGERG